MYNDLSAQLLTYRREQSLVGQFKVQPVGGRETKADKIEVCLLELRYATSFFFLYQQLLKR